MSRSDPLKNPFTKHTFRSRLSTALLPLALLTLSGCDAIRSPLIGGGGGEETPAQNSTPTTSVRQAGYQKVEDAYREALESAYMEDLNTFRQKGVLAGEVAMTVRLAQFHARLAHDPDKAIQFGEMALTLIQKGAAASIREPDSHFFELESSGITENSRRTNGAEWMARRKRAFYEAQKNWTLLVLDQAHTLAQARREREAIKHARAASNYRSPATQPAPVAEGPLARPIMQSETVAPQESAQTSAISPTTTISRDPTTTMPTPPPKQRFDETPTGEPALAPQVARRMDPPPQTYAALVEQAAPPPPKRVAPSPASVRETTGTLPDFSRIRDVKKKKEAFFNFMLPHIRSYNAKLNERRERIETLWDQVSQGSMISPDEQNWLVSMVDLYKIDRSITDSDAFFSSLLKRVDIVPASLALAQAAVESGWASTRFARHANNIYGDRCFSKGCGIVPDRRDPGATHEIARYASVSESVRNYMHNLNTQKHFARFRELRSSLRARRDAMTGKPLTPGLGPFASDPKKYISTINSMIRINRLQRFDAQ